MVAMIEKEEESLLQARPDDTIADPTGFEGLAGLSTCIKRVCCIGWVRMVAIYLYSCVHQVRPIRTLDRIPTLRGMR